MKGFALLVGAIAGAALLYVTTAVGGQQAGPSRAEFNALKKQVATLKKDDLAIQAVLNGCFNGAVPAASFGGYEYRAADGSTVIATALDIAADRRNTERVSPRRRPGLRERASTRRSSTCTSR